MKKLINVLMIALLVLGTLTGCSRNLSFTYFNPAWSHDGRIYAIREDSEFFMTGGFSGSTGRSSDCWLVIMDKDGGNESAVLHLGQEKFPQINASPGGKYVALWNSYEIDVYDIDAGYKKISRILSIDYPNEGRINSIDWSPNENRIIIYDNEITSLYSIKGRNLFADSKKSCCSESSTE